MFKFQLWASSGFWIYRRINKFSRKKSPFLLCCFVSQFSITWTSIPKIGKHDAFINCYVESKFQLSGFYRLLVISKSNPHLPKLATETKVLRAHAKSQLQSKYYTFMWELTANNCYQCNCVDLKPVPIMRFIFQFEFRIVWDSDPSGFGILKCPSLLMAIPFSY